MKRLIEIREYEHADLTMLRDWLAQSHVKEWYPVPDSNLDWASRPPANGGHALIELEGNPVGYIRWTIVSRAILDSVGLSEVPTGSADVDILIGDKRHVSQGIGPVALSLLASRLTEQGGVPLIGLTTSKKNTAAHRAFEKAGFSKTAEYSPDGFGDCYLFTLSLRK